MSTWVWEGHNPIGRPFLWEVVDCHFTLPFVSRVGFSLPDLLSQVLANLCHVQEVTVPMKHRSWSDVITKEMVALGNCEKTNATETL